MKKSTKGAVAAAAAGALLLGGAGSLAYWTDAEAITGGSFSSGQLNLGTPDCDPGTGTGSVWTLDGETTAFDPATKIVPGDTLTKVCTTTLTATGKHLEAELTVAGGDLSSTNALTSALETSAVYKIGTTTVTSSPAIVTSADNLKTLTATITVKFPYGDAGTNGLVGESTNETQDLSAVLDDITVTAKQVHTP